VLQGIVDFGDGNRGYTAIDLVKAALDYDTDSAFYWLKERVDPSDVVINLNAASESAKRKRGLDTAEITREEHGKMNMGGNVLEFVRDNQGFLSFSWDREEPLVLPEFLVEDMISEHDIGLLSGESTADGASGLRGCRFDV
jgi:hypothetical protein